MSVEWVLPSNHLILCCPLLLLPSSFPSIRVFSNESVLHIMWPKYWNFSISPSSEYSWVISLGLTDLISLQSKGLSRVFSSTINQSHQFFIMVQLSHPYMMFRALTQIFFCLASVSLSPCFLCEVETYFRAFFLDAKWNVTFGQNVGPRLLPIEATHQLI